MDIADKTRLSKLLGMLGSSFDGERANAAAMIQKMAEKYKLTITELVAASHGVASTTKKGWQPPPKDDWSTRPWPEHPDEHSGYERRKHNGLNGDDLLSKLAALVDGGWRGLTDWERQFASDVSDRYEKDYELTERQLAVVQRIIGKAERSGVKWKGRP